MNPISTDARYVWILDEGSQGHVVQSRGLLKELSKAISLNVVEVPIRSILPRRFSRSLAKRLLRRSPSPWMFHLLYPSAKLPQKTPDLIVSSGPHSLAALEYFTKLYRCPSVFVQGTISVPKGAVSVIMRPFEGEHRDDFIFIPLLFTEITPDAVRQAGKEFLARTALRPNGPVNTLMIGSSSAKIAFSKADWESIVQFVNALWKRDGSQWLITTSHRTGREIETLLKRGILPEAILDVVWYSEAPRKVIKSYLGVSERIFVTMDSLTMLTEAVASGRPTYALCPAEAAGEKSNTHLEYVRNLAANGFITLIRPDQDEVFEFTHKEAPVIDYAEAIQQLLSRLQWTR